MRRKILFKTCMMAAIIIIVILFEIHTEQDTHYTPDYEKIDIRPILRKPVLSKDDYYILLKQTGLGRPAIDSIMKQPNGIEQIMPYQTAFFKRVDYRCESLVFVTKQEYLINNAGEYIHGFPLAPIEDGYVLLTKGAHTLGWRNGHAGLMVDSSEGKILEAITIGENSAYQSVDKWRTYPSFIMLKLKDVSSIRLSKIAKAASLNLIDIPYQLTPGIFNNKYSDLRNLSGTHCAHLIWEAFRYFGYDIDFNGGSIVTVRDIALSPLFEIVQIYGINPENLWE